ncbi:MAG: ATP-dependent helicase [Oligoflexus sp.]
MSHLFDNLNESQRQAVSHFQGPYVVFAGAGSGKTRIITTRIAYLIERGVPPWEILAVTFTNKAAGEMKERIERLCPEAKRATITTFHSACARWLREFASELGFTTNFSIYDDSDSTKALKKIMKEANPNIDLPTAVPEMKMFLHHVKTMGYFPGDVERLSQELSYPIPAGGVEFYRLYQEYLADCNAMDFGDLLLNMLLLLQRNEQVRKIMTHRFQYILVDEFQDTNRTQFELIRILASHHQNLFVVGDDDQSIYSWRGATPANILDFHRTFPKAGKVALEENYRCTANIVKAASHMIANNKTRAAKTLFTRAPAGEPIEVHVEIDGEMEAYWVAEQIKHERQAFPYDEIAVFYRTNSQSRVFEEAFRRLNIPYTIFGSAEFYDRLEVKDIIAYLKVLLNEQDEMSLRRIINVPGRGIGDKAVETIEREARARKVSMMEAIRQMADEKIPRIGPKLKYFADLMAALKADILELPLEDVLSTLLDALEYPEYLKKKFPDQYVDKLDNIHELGSGIAEFAKREENPSLENWLQSVSLVKDDRDPTATQGVTMMTLHMAKGLEFRRVYLVGMEEGLLPHRNSLEDHSQLEEERRLFYVGITRCREKLSLVAAGRRRNFQSITANPPSRFFKELPDETLQLSNSAEQILKVPTFVGSRSHASSAVAEAWDQEDESSYVYEADPEQLKNGMGVYHPTFGRGTITGFDTRFGQFKVVVKFHDFGLRKIRPSQLSIQRSTPL